jgi:hypothetical protein
MCGLGELCFSVVAAGTLAMVGVLDKFYVEVMENVLLLQLARVAGNWLWWDDMAKVGFMRKVKGKNVVGGGSYTDAFLASERCRQPAIIPLTLGALCWVAAP